MSWDHQIANPQGLKVLQLTQLLASDRGGPSDKRL